MWSMWSYAPETIPLRALYAFVFAFVLSLLSGGKLYSKDSLLITPKEQSYVFVLDNQEIKTIDSSISYINVLDETLAYEVDQILVVEPEETEALAVVEGEDLLTLLTCTPYGMNTQRLMVRGHRVPYSPNMIAEGKAPLGAYSLHTNYVFWVVVGLLITGTFILLLYLLDKKRRKS